MQPLLTGLLLVAPCLAQTTSPVEASTTLNHSDAAAPARAGALRLLLVPSSAGTGSLDLICQGGRPGEIVRLFAAPSAGNLTQSRPIARTTMDGNGSARFGLPAGLSDLELVAVADSDSLLFGAQVSGKIQLPVQAPATGTQIPKAGAVLICEIHKDPSAVSDSKGEWIEFYNTTAQPIDIEGWVLSDLGSDATVLDHGGAGIVVPARGYAVVARELDTAQNGGVTAVAAYSQFTLSNGDDEVVLSRPNGLLVDEVRYDDASWPDTAGATLQLSNIRLGPLWNDDPMHWCAGSQAYGDGDLGTPGAKNDDC